MDTSEQRARRKLCRALAATDTVHEGGVATYWGDERLRQHMLGACLSGGENDVDVATLISNVVLFNEFVRKASSTGFGGVSDDSSRVAESLIHSQPIKDRDGNAHWIYCLSSLRLVAAEIEGAGLRRQSRRSSNKDVCASGCANGAHAVNCFLFHRSQVPIPTRCALLWQLDFDEVSMHAADSARCDDADVVGDSTVSTTAQSHNYIVSNISRPGILSSRLPRRGVLLVRDLPVSVAEMLLVLSRRRDRKRTG